MVIDLSVFNQIATSLAKHFDVVYYVDLETGDFVEFVHSDMFKQLPFPTEGKDFFRVASEGAPKYVYPDDLENVLRIHTKEVILQNIAKGKSYSISSRLLIDGKIIHIRHVNILCDDQTHLLCCMENIEEEVQEKEMQEKNLQSAERMARLDELTGIKNKNAFTEFSRTIDSNIQSKKEDYHFAIVMGDLNDLKRINDTRGHSFGDEAIQKASRMICEVYKHSPVFRIGGDEFVVLLQGSDYEKRDELLQELKDESDTNRKTSSGPTVATGMAVFDPQTDKDFTAVFKRADANMYENKAFQKSQNVVEVFRKMDNINNTITADRKRNLDSLFGALFTVAGSEYVYLNDMHYDYSRWSLPLIDDFGLQSEYMYHADTVWKEYVHPDDLNAYVAAVDAVLCGGGVVNPLYYRARKPDGSYVLLTTRGFILNDAEGKPEYFGGIIIPK